MLCLSTCYACFNVGPHIKTFLLWKNKTAHKRRGIFSLLPELLKALLMHALVASVTARFARLSVLDVFLFLCSWHNKAQLSAHKSEREDTLMECCLLVVSALYHLHFGLPIVAFSCGKKKKEWILAPQETNVGRFVQVLLHWCRDIGFLLVTIGWQIFPLRLILAALVVEIENQCG